jgi:hypothetical protein
MKIYWIATWQNFQNSLQEFLHDRGLGEDLPAFYIEHARVRLTNIKQSSITTQYRKEALASSFEIPNAGSQEE